MFRRRLKNVLRGIVFCHHGKGSKPTANNFIDWAKQDFLAPVPLIMDHHPIVNLFSDEILLKQQTLNLTAAETQSLRRWIVPAYEQYFVSIAKKRNETVKSGCGLTDNCKFNEICSETTSGHITCSSPLPWNECLVTTNAWWNNKAVPTEMITPSLFATSSFKGIWSPHEATARGYYHSVAFSWQSFTSTYYTYWSSASAYETSFIGFQTPICRPMAVSRIAFSIVYKMSASDFKLYGRPCLTKGITIKMVTNRFNFDYPITYWNQKEQQSCEMEELPFTFVYRRGDRNHHEFWINSPKYFHSYLIRMRRSGTYATMYNLRVSELSCARTKHGRIIDFSSLAGMSSDITKECKMSMGNGTIGFG